MLISYTPVQNEIYFFFFYIYTDSKYAYLTLHVHAAIWKESQFKTATGEPIKHFRESERLLTDIDCSKEVAVMYFKGHSRDRS